MVGEFGLGDGEVVGDGVGFFVEGAVVWGGEDFEFVGVAGGFVAL